MTTILQKHHILLSAARFAVVGLLGTLVDFTLFALLSLLIGLPALAANTISYGAGILNNYYFHRTWTYAHNPRKTVSSGKAVGKQFLLFVAVSLIALGINNLVVYVMLPSLTAHLANPYLAAVLAKACATAAGLSWNFLANHFWTFR